MQDHDLISAEPVVGGVSRRTALKAGGLGLVGAVASFLPGRAVAGVRKRSEPSTTCNGVNATYCGYIPYKCGDGCSCVTVHGLTLGTKRTLCGQGSTYYGNFNCSSSNSCLQSPCPKGSFCADPSSTCCSLPVCVPLCGTGG